MNQLHFIYIILRHSAKKMDFFKKSARMYSLGCKKELKKERKGTF